MRFADRVTFFVEKGKKYNPYTGEYDEGKVIEKTLPCHISGMKIDRKKEVFGSINKNVVVIRLKKPYLESFDYAKLKSTKPIINENLKYIKMAQSDYDKGVVYLEGVSDGS